MATSAACGSIDIVRGKRLRATRVDSCGLPLEGCQSTLVTDGFVTAAITRVNKDAEDLEQLNADGRFCVLDRTPPELKWLEVTLTICNVDINLMSMFTDDPLVIDYAGRPVGFRTHRSVPVDTGVALELWTGTGSDNCEVPTDDSVFTSTASAQSFGYLLLPTIREGVMGDIEIGASVATFTITGITAIGYRWGRGPYDVVTSDAGGTPSRLFEAMNQHMHLQLTELVPPEVTCGAVELIVPRPYFGAGPSNEVQKITLTGATGGTFVLTHESNPTTALAYNASPAAVQAALEALPSIGAGNVSVTAGCHGYVIVFIGTLAGTDESQITADDTLTTPAAATVVGTTVHTGGIT